MFRNFPAVYNHLHFSYVVNRGTGYYEQQISLQDGTRVMKLLYASQRWQNLDSPSKMDLRVQ